MEELERHVENIRVQVSAEFVPEDVHLLPKALRENIYEWCNQVSVLGLNSGFYDLNVIEKYFVDRLTEITPKPKVGAKGKKKIFVLTPGFRFLDIINYVGPRTSYEKWVKEYGCKAEKSEKMMKRKSAEKMRIKSTEHCEGRFSRIWKKWGRLTG